jgi:hypothetical protein
MTYLYSTLWPAGSITCKQVTRLVRPRAAGYKGCFESGTNLACPYVPLVPCHWHFCD